MYTRRFVVVFSAVLTFDMSVPLDLLHDGVPLSLVGDAQVVLERLSVDDVVAEEVEVVVPVVDEAPLVLVQPHRAQPLRNRVGLLLPLHRGVLHRGQGG